MKRPSALIAGALLALLSASPTSAQDKKPNIVVIMGDDIGWFNIGAYHQGIMSGRTPNLDKSPPREFGSPTTTPRRAAPRVAPPSSPASCPSAPA